jgi:hypothetical protein
MEYLILALIGLLAVGMVWLEWKIEKSKQPRDSKGKFLPKQKGIE